MTEFNPFRILLILSKFRLRKLVHAVPHKTPIFNSGVRL